MIDLLDSTTHPNEDIPLVTPPDKAYTKQMNMIPIPQKINVKPKLPYEDESPEFKKPINKVSPLVDSKSNTHNKGISMRPMLSKLNLSNTLFHLNEPTLEKANHEKDISLKHKYDIYGRRQTTEYPNYGRYCNLHITLVEAQPEEIGISEMPGVPKYDPAIQPGDTSIPASRGGSAFALLSFTQEKMIKDGKNLSGPSLWSSKSQLSQRSQRDESPLDEIVISPVSIIMPKACYSSTEIGRDK